MTFRRLGIVLGIALLATFFYLQPTYAAKASRIELKNGQVYEDVLFNVDDVSKIITIEKVDGKVIVNLKNVLQIIDENGLDITSNYRYDYYEPPPESKEELLADLQVKQKGYNAKPFDFAIALAGNISIPTGNYYSGTKTGLGFGFDALVPLNKNFAIKGVISRSGMQHNLKPSLRSVYRLLEDNLSLNVWRHILAAQYYHWPRWQTGGKFMIYASAGMGNISHEMTGTMTVKNLITNEISYIYGTGKNENKFILSYGAGLMIIPSKQVGIDLGFTWDIVFIGTERYGEGVYANIYDIKIALVGLF